LSSANFEFALWLSALPLLLVAATFTWLLSLPLRNVSLVDALWSLLLFAAGVVYALGSDPRAPRLSLVLWLCAIWAGRFAWQRARDSLPREGAAHAALRARHEPHFGLKSLYLVFLPRTLAAWVVSLPLMGAFASIRPWTWLEYASILLWTAGFLFETVADWQRRRGVTDSGLWRYTRHPGHFGECCIGWAFYGFALSAGAWWALPGPVLLTLLLLRSAGVRPFGNGGGNDQPQNADYVLKTNAFFPGRPRN
jgi:steroid 5-alpha reductase family enzyme